MNAYQEFVLQTAKETIKTMEEKGNPNKDILAYLDVLTMIYEGPELVAELTKLRKEHETNPSLDNLIKNAADKSNEQTLKEEKNFDLER